MIAWLMLALAQESSADPPVSEVIIVYGEEQVRVAREKVIQDLRDLGYTNLKEKDGRLLLLHEQNWKGKVVLHDDGFVQFRRQGPKGTTPDTFFSEASPLIGWVPCIIVPTACVKMGGVVVSERKLSQVEAKTSAAIAADLDALHQRQADLYTQRKMEALPEQLAACWEQGAPLDGDAALPDAASRRLHLLRYWDSRTETVWGEKIRGVVADFLNGVVQASDTPVTQAELDAINAGRPEPLVLRGLDAGAP